MINLSRAAASCLRAVRHLSLFPLVETSSFFLYCLMQLLLFFPHLQHPHCPSLWPREASACWPAVLPLEQAPHWVKTGITSFARSLQTGWFSLWRLIRGRWVSQHTRRAHRLSSANKSLWLLFCSVTQPQHITQLTSPA